MTAVDDRSQGPRMDREIRTRCRDQVVFHDSPQIRSRNPSRKRTPRARSTAGRVGAKDRQVFPQRTMRVRTRRVN